MFCFLGFIGLFNTVASFLLLIMFDYFDWEKFRWPPDFDAWLIMTMYAVSEIIVVYCWAKADVFLGPGISSSIYAMITYPFVIWFDIVVVDEPVKITAVFYVGCCLVIFVFLTITYINLAEDKT